MKYCSHCCYPENAKPTIIFDEEGVCSGCRLIESRPEVNWEERFAMLEDIVSKYKGKHPLYDCIIPVSGGKDSTFQTYFVTQVLKLKPLLVAYNHSYNTELGMRNLRNLVKQFGCNLIRYTTSPESARKLSRYSLKRMGDVTWHYHAGIQTLPIQTAVNMKIPLIIWGEEGFSELTGMHNQDDMVEFTKKKRQEHSMRGFEPDDVLKDPIAQEEGITAYDLAPFYYPSNEDLESIGVRGIYLSNFMYWNARKQTEFIIEKYGFETAYERDRTFNIYDKLDDIHANGLHDYMKYLKFGYGRATDDASTEIRHGRMTRNEGIDMVMKYDHVRPQDMDLFLEFVDMTEDEFMGWIEKHRDSSIWEKANGEWKTKDNVGNYKENKEEMPKWKEFKPSDNAVKKNLNKQDNYIIL